MIAKVLERVVRCFRPGQEGFRVFEPELLPLVRVVTPEVTQRVEHDLVVRAGAAVGKQELLKR
jgi:hypothetical protein